MNRREFLSTVCVAALTAGWKHGSATGGSSFTWTTINPTAPFTDGVGIIASPPAGSRVIHVSSTDVNRANVNADNAGSSTAPFATIAFASNYLRTGKPDQLLLKKGDTFLNDVIQVLLNGVAPSPTNVPGNIITGPILIGAYGTGTTRPLIKTDHTISAFYSATGGPGNTTGNVAFIGIECWAFDRDANGTLTSLGVNSSPSAINGQLPGDWFLIEDCKFSFYSTNVSFNVPITTTYTNFMMRRCQILDAYDPNGHSQGFFIASTQILCEENFFDHNGWNDQPAVIAIAGTAVQQTEFNHNIYCSQDCIPPIQFVNNIYSNDGGGGQFRQGGNIAGNLFVQNAIALNCFRTGGTITGNFIWNSTDVPGTGLGWGMDITPSKGSATTLISQNVIANSVAAAGGAHGITVSERSPDATGRFTSGLALVDCVSTQVGTDDGPVAFEDGYYLGDSVVCVQALTTWSGAQYFPPGSAGTVNTTATTPGTFSDPNNAMTYPNATPCTLQVGATLPSPLVSGTVYYIRNPVVASGITTFNLSATPSGALINIAAGAFSFRVNSGQFTMSKTAISNAIDHTFFTIPQLVTISNNIVFKQAQPAFTPGNADDGIGTVITGNAIDVSGSNIGGPPGTPGMWPSPTITVGSYMVSLGTGTTIADFLTKCGQQSKDTWDSRYTAAAAIAYLKTGFGL